MKIGLGSEFVQKLDPDPTKIIGSGSATLLETIPSFKRRRKKPSRHCLRTRLNQLSIFNSRKNMSEDFIVIKAQK